MATTAATQFRGRPASILDEVWLSLPDYMYPSLIDAKDLVWEQGRIGTLTCETDLVPLQARSAPRAARLSGQWCERVQT